MKKNKSRNISFINILKDGTCPALTTTYWQRGISIRSFFRADGKFSNPGVVEFIDDKQCLKN